MDTSTQRRGAYLQSSQGLDPKILELIKQEATKAAEEVYNKQGTKYGVSQTPTHGHDNIGSTQLSYINNIPSRGDGVLSPAQLTGIATGVAATAMQTVNQGTTGTPSLSSLVSVSIPIIQGFGSIFPTNLTGSPAAGATSGTLAAGVWGGANTTVAAQFGYGEIRLVKYTTGSSTVTWAGGLLQDPLTANLTQIGCSRFHGGSAALGTMVFFINPDDGIRQLWIRTDFIDATVLEERVSRWAGFDGAGIGTGTGIAP